MKMKLSFLSLITSLFSISCSETTSVKNDNLLPTEIQNDISTTNKTVDTTTVNKIHIPEVIEPPLIVQQECYFEKTKKPAKGKIDTRNWIHVVIENEVRYEGKVCITTKTFQGTSPYNIPFVATIWGDISELYVNNQKIKFDGEGEIFFRQKIALEHGYNRIPVKAIGKSGELSESFVEVTIEGTAEKIEIKTTE